MFESGNYCFLRTRNRKLKHSFGINLTEFQEQYMLDLFLRKVVKSYSEKDYCELNNTKNPRKKSYFKK